MGFKEHLLQWLPALISDETSPLPHLSHFSGPSHERRPSWDSVLRTQLRITELLCFNWFNSAVLGEGERGGLQSEKWVNARKIGFISVTKIYREFGSVTQIIDNYREINKPHTFIAKACMLSLNVFYKKYFCRKQLRISPSSLHCPSITPKLQVLFECQLNFGTRGENWADHNLALCSVCTWPGSASLRKVPE